jgi:hypothetical protein
MAQKGNKQSEEELPKEEQEYELVISPYFVRRGGSRRCDRHFARMAYYQVKKKEGEEEE